MAWILDRHKGRLLVDTNVLEETEENKKSIKVVTAGLPVSLTWGLRHKFCCRGPILIPIPVLESPSQTTRVNVLDFL